MDETKDFIDVDETEQIPSEESPFESSCSDISPIGDGEDSPEISGADTSTTGNKKEEIVSKIKETLKKVSIVVGKFLWKFLPSLIFFFGVIYLTLYYVNNTPEVYKVEVKLAPEVNSSSGISSLSNIASSFGVDLGASQSEDAVSPEIYPDLFQSTNFAIGLLAVPVVSKDGRIHTTYYDYLMHHQKHAPWEPTLNKWRKKFSSKKEEPVPVKGKDVVVPVADSSFIDPYHLTEEQEGCIKKVTDNIVCSIDKQTNVISISVKDQDPLIASTMADSARAHLQDFITNYRTNKARVDLEYYTKLLMQAKADYKKSVDLYSAYADCHQGDLLQSYQSKRDELENDMQFKYNAMTALAQQLESAKAKVQERTPAFTTVWNSTVPVKPYGPKRMLYVSISAIFALFCIFVWKKRRKLFGDDKSDRQA